VGVGVEEIVVDAGNVLDRDGATDAGGLGVIGVVPGALEPSDVTVVCAAG
jgi:hypothetical protein